MKWGLVFFDPQNILLKEPLDNEFVKLQEELEKFLDVDIFIMGDNDPIGAYGKLLDSYIKIRKDYDHISLVYDGARWLDGLANDSFYAICYNNNRDGLNHHTYNLLDGYTSLNYEEGNGQKLIAECLYRLLMKFTSNVEYPNDGCKLQEKLDKIQELKQYFEPKYIGVN